MYYFVQNVCHTASIIVMMVIALERYIAIVHPMINKRLANVWIRRVTSAVIWLVAIAYGAPLIAIYDVIEAEDVGRSHHDVTTLKPYCVRVAGVNMAAHVTINFVVCYCAPLVMLALVYSRIGRVLVRTSKLADKVLLMVASNNDSINKKNCSSSPLCSNGIQAKSPLSTSSAAGARSRIVKQLGFSPKLIIGRALSERSAATVSILTAKGQCRLSMADKDKDRQIFLCHHQLSDCHWQRHTSAKCYCQKAAGRDRIRNSGRQYTTTECFSSPDVVFTALDSASDADSTENFLDNIVMEETTLEKQPHTELCAENRGSPSPTHKQLLTSKPSPLHLHLLGPRACTSCKSQNNAASNKRTNKNNANCLSESTPTAFIVDDSLIHTSRHTKQAKTGAYEITVPLVGEQQQTSQTPILQQRKWLQSSNISVIQSRRKVVRLLVVVVTSFALCSLPYQVTFGLLVYFNIRIIIARRQHIKSVVDC